MNILDRIWKSDCKAWIFPLTFVFCNLVNFTFYYLGLAYQENIVRSAGFAAAQLLFAVVCGLLLLATLKNTRMARRSWLLLLLVLAFYGLSFAGGIMKFGVQGALRTYLVKFITFVLPAFFAGICGALNQTEDRFFPILDKLTWLMFPGALIYTNGLLFNCNPFGYGRFLGIMGYMNFAYAIMPFLLVQLLAFSDRVPLEVPILHKKVVHPQLVRGVFIAVFWLAIVGSGTRGTYVAVAVFCMFLVISKLLHREEVKRAFAASAVMALVLLFTMFIYAPPGMYAVHRMDMFIKGLSQGEIITDENEAADVQEKLDSLVEANGGQQITNRPEDPSADNQDPETDTEENIQIGNRGTLYKLALKEFLKSPVTGMGLSGYEVKYGINPHNVVLELLCEVGLLGGIPFLLLLLIAVFSVLRAGWTNRSIRYIFLFLIAYAVRANIGGYLWQCDYLACALGYGLCLFGRSVKATEAATETASDVCA